MCMCIDIHIYKYTNIHIHVNFPVPWVLDVTLVSRRVPHDDMYRWFSRPKVPAEGRECGRHRAVWTGAIAEPCCKENNGELRDFAWFWEHHLYRLQL